jgi:acetoin utilization deacetylase AcuC-like enzyme
MRFVYSPEHLHLDPVYEVEHGVQSAASDIPARAEAIRRALEEDTDFVVDGATDHGTGPIEAIHDAGLLRFLEQAWAEWAGSRKANPLYADTFLHYSLGEGMERPPEPIELGSRMGYWCFDMYTPVVQGTYAAARAAVDVALTAADLVLEGEPVVYGLCRPPGHHAGPKVFGGSCYLNNAAVAAQYLLERSGSRLSILDVDQHHGNGTQQVFYSRSDVLYVSIHADPSHYYPHFTGNAREIGAAQGEGFNLNLPLRGRCGQNEYLLAVERALDAIAAFDGSAVIVSLGLDTYCMEDDGGLGLTTPFFHEVGRKVASVGTPLLILQEGGYYVPDLGKNTRQWLRGAAGLLPDLPRG